MKTLGEFMATLEGKRVSLSLEAGQLRYTAPKGALCPEDLEDIKQRKSELIPFLAAKSAGHSDILRCRRASAIRPAWQQESWWRNVELKRIGVDWTNLAKAVRIRGRLDVNALECSLNELIRRHELLRTRYISNGGRPLLQLDKGNDRFKLSAYDLRHSVSTEEAAQQLATDLSRQPFDNAVDSMIRADLLRLGAEDHVLLIVVNHIVSDAQTQRGLWYELIALYDAITLRRSFALPRLPLQYMDYASWQRNWLTDELLEHSSKYWNSRLRGHEFALPTDPRSEPSGRNRTLFTPLQIPENLAASLLTLSLKLQKPRALIMLAAFKTLLAIWSGQREIGVASVGSLRNRPELAHMAGYFSCTNPILTDLSGDPSFEEILSRTTSGYSDSIAHQVPAFLMDQFRRLRIYWNYQVVAARYLSERSESSTSPWGYLDVSPFGLLHITDDAHDDGRYLLSAVVQEAGNKIEGFISFTSHHLSAATGALFVRRLITLLQILSNDPSASIGQIEKALNAH